MVFIYERPDGVPADISEDAMKMKSAVIRFIDEGESEIVWGEGPVRVSEGVFGKYRDVMKTVIKEVRIRRDHQIGRR